MPTMVRETWTDERLDDLTKRVDEGFREVKEEQRLLRTELKAEMAKQHGELKTEMKELKRELRGEMATLKSELRGEMGSSKMKWENYAPLSTASAVGSTPCC